MVANDNGCRVNLPTHVRQVINFHGSTLAKLRKSSETKAPQPEIDRYMYMWDAMPGTPRASVGPGVSVSPLVFQCRPLPTTEQLRLDLSDFNDFALSADEMVLGALRIFQHCGFLHTFHIEYEVRWGGVGWSGEWLGVVGQGRVRPDGAE